MDRAHKRRIHAITTALVAVGMCATFLPSEYLHYGFIVNAMANLWWIWVE